MKKLLAWMGKRTKNYFIGMGFIGAYFVFSAQEVYRDLPAHMNDKWYGIFIAFIILAALAAVVLLTVACIAYIGRYYKDGDAEKKAAKEARLALQQARAEAKAAKEKAKENKE